VHTRSGAEGNKIAVQWPGLGAVPLHLPSGFSTRVSLPFDVSTVCHPHAIVPQVLEGYMFLGTLPTLGGEVSACFGNVVAAGALAAVQGVLRSRPGCGPDGIASMHEAVRLLPPDLFKTALSRVGLCTALPCCTLIVVIDASVAVHCADVD